MAPPFGPLLAAEGSLRRACALEFAARRGWAFSRAPACRSSAASAARSSYPVASVEVQLTSDASTSCHAAAPIQRSAASRCNSSANVGAQGVSTQVAQRCYNHREAVSFGPELVDRVDSLLMMFISLAQPSERGLGRGRGCYAMESMRAHAPVEPNEAQAALAGRSANAVPGETCQDSRVGLTNAWARAARLRTGQVHVQFCTTTRVNGAGGVVGAPVFVELSPALRRPFCSLAYLHYARVIGAGSYGFGADRRSVPKRSPQVHVGSNGVFRAGRGCACIGADQWTVFTTRPKVRRHGRHTWSCWRQVGAAPWYEASDGPQRYQVNLEQQKQRRVEPCILY